MVDLVPEAGLGSEQEQTLLHPAEFELGETTGASWRRLSRSDRRGSSLTACRSCACWRKPHCAIDGKSSRLSTASRAIAHLLLLDDQTAEPRDLQLHSIAHGVIALEQGSNIYGAERRSLRVVKVRGVQFRGGYHDYTIGTGGLAVYPRLVAAEHPDRFSPDPVGTGVARTGRLAGRWVVPGTSTLIMGPTGTGRPPPPPVASSLR